VLGHETAGWIVTYVYVGEHIANDFFAMSRMDFDTFRQIILIL
jgi:hypothetical protein